MPILNRNHYAGPLFADLYELTMAAGYHAHGVMQEATFSLFIRNFPPQRNYFVAAGLEDVLNALESYRFSKDEIQYLQTTGLFAHNFIDYLKQLRFSGEVWAMPEGTIFFPNEPILEITAPIIEAQMIETFILNTIGFSTLIASKAARCVIAAQGRPLIDFALRRTQGKDAGMMVARSTYMAGFAGTSNVLAGKVYGMPTSGTMAHSFICAFDSEREAFTAYSETHPQNTILLIDTFDTLEGAHRAGQVAQVLKKRGQALNGVRLDSGDMIDLSFKVRKILDQSGFSDVKIYASTGFDEFTIAEAVSRDARIDAFGAGTKVGVSSDAPYVDIVYKLVRFKDRNVRKLSTNKTTLAGKKQVFRRLAQNGRYVEDVIGDRDEDIKRCRPLLIKVMSNGRRVGALNSLQAIRAQFKDNLADLPQKYKALTKVGDFPVKISPRLYAQQDSVHP